MGSLEFIYICIFYVKISYKVLLLPPRIVGQTHVEMKPRSTLQNIA